MAAAVTGVVVAYGVVGPAQAAPARIRFNVAAQSYSDALLDIAQQANITLIGAASCPGGSSRVLAGRMSVEEALGRLLEAAPCEFRVIAPGAIEITAIKRAEPERLSVPVEVREVLVTATRRVRDPRELAVAITAVPRGDLLKAGAHDAAEAAGQFAGVQATNLGPGRNKLLLRGLSDGAYTGRARSIVVTYLDDLPINYNAPDPDLRLVDVERIEVARGPQGALYGAGSLSGIYRIVSRRPDLEDYSTELSATGATTQGGEHSYAGEGYLNVPLWGVAGLRVSGYREVQGGYMDDILHGRSNVDRTRRQGARLMFRARPNDAISIDLTAAGQQLRSDDTHYTTPGLGLRRTVGVPEPHSNDIRLASGVVRLSWDWAELSSSTGFVRHRYASIYDATARQDLYTDFATTSAYSEVSRTKLLVQDLVLTSRGAGPVEWLAGAYASETRVHAPTEFLANVPFAGLNVLVYGDDRRDHIRELAAYGELSYEFAPNWTVAAGGRVFTIRSHTRSDVVAEKYPSRSFDRSVDFTGFSPKLSVQRRFESGDMVYAVLSEGFRAGGINSGGATPLLAPRETFAPDRLLNLEVGAKLEPLDGRLLLNTAAFYDRWSNIQTDQYRSSGIPYTTNAGDVQLAGLEAELQWRSDIGLSAQVNGRVTWTRPLRVNADFTNRLVKGLPGAPKASGGFVLTYARPVFGDWTFRSVAQATYVGRSRVTFDSTQAQMGDYARTKLLAELSNGRFGAQAYVANPLDAFSDTFAFGNPFNPDQVRQVTPQRPITVGLTISAAL